MIDLCEYAVSTGDKIGADETEAQWVRNISIAVEAESRHISQASKTRNEGMRIRVIKDKALGSFFTYRMDNHSIERAVEKAATAARASDTDEHWVSLPQPRRYSRVDVWDSALAHVSSEALLEPVMEILNVIPQDIQVLAAGNQVTLQERACCNSNGITHYDRSALGELYIEATGKLEEGVTPAFSEFSLLRKYNPDPHRIAESVATKIALFRNQEPASPGKSKVILSPRALMMLWYFTLFKTLSGENVARGKSVFSMGEGELVASPQVTLHDNGVILEGVESREMDDEGVPRQNTLLIEEGVLKGFIWNDYWANRMDVKSTGNAHYDDRTGNMTIEQTTMVLSPGDYKQEDLFDIKDGYYILEVQGARASTPESGDFSVLCNPAYRIRNGEITGGCTGMMISDNIYQLLHRIDAKGSELEVNEYAALPHVRFSDVNVASK
ncbi:MAG: TldD/PmbA family protein [Theionarchaea archaeon]|nr:TldD/PmbA family protein [Theionarchaea archaeon]